MTRSALSSNTIGGISLYGGVLGFGCNSDLVCMPGVADSGHPDCFAVPRPAEPGVTGSLPAAAPVTWAGQGKASVVSVICDTKWKHGGKDNWQGACPRAIARRQLQDLASMGFSLKSACEYEFRGEPSSRIPPSLPPFPHPPSLKYFPSRYTRLFYRGMHLSSHSAAPLEHPPMHQSIPSR